MDARWMYFPAGAPVTGAEAGDFLLCHRKGFMSALIRAGERIRFRSGARWSHAAFVEDGRSVIEALARGVVRTPLSVYTDVDVVLVRTCMNNVDRMQATRFVQSCLGQRYGFPTYLGLVLRFLTPGRGLYFGLDGTEICSGLVAQAMVRGWANFRVNPAQVTPAELAEYYQAPSTSRSFVMPENDVHVLLELPQDLIDRLFAINPDGELAEIIDGLVRGAQA